MDDLRQIGTMGLLNTIERFDPERGVSFSSFAIPNMLGAILNYLRDHGGLIKVPRKLRRNKITVDKVSESLATTLGRWPTVPEIAETCQLSEDQIWATIELSRIGDPRSLEEVIDINNGQGTTTLGEYISAEDGEFEAVEDKLSIANAISRLTAREQTVIRLRFYEGFSQRQIAERLNLSQMHISRIERAALARLKSILLKNDTLKEIPQKRLLESGITD
jgi:RNA polymerase sigma-B factor